MTQAPPQDAANDRGQPAGHDPALHRALVAGLYSEALLLADEARAWFDGGGPAGQWQASGPTPLAQVTLGCESLRVTMRITHALSWLMAERARLTANPGDAHPALFQGTVPAPDEATLALLPAAAVRLIRASERLLVRINRIVGAPQAGGEGAPAAPVHALLDRLRARY